jgi:hypothetical protein
MHPVIIVFGQIQGVAWRERYVARDGLQSVTHKIGEREVSLLGTGVGSPAAESSQE